MADDSLAATTAQDTHDSLTVEEGGADAHADAPEAQIEQGTLRSASLLHSALHPVRSTTS